MIIYRCKTLGEITHKNNNKSRGSREPISENNLHETKCVGVVLDDPMDK